MAHYCESGKQSINRTDAPLNAPDGNTMINSLFSRIANPFRQIPPARERRPGHGERQVAPTLDGIRVDHTARYHFAASKIPPDSRILDMACGVGYGSFILAQETDCASITAVDISQDAISYARTHYATPKIGYIQGDCLDVALPPAAYDIAISFETLEHITDDSRLLRRFNELLVPDGKLILSTPNQLVKPYKPEKFPFHVRHYTPDELTALTGSAGFDIQAVWSQAGNHAPALAEGWNGAFNIILCTKTNVPS